MSTVELVGVTHAYEGHATLRGIDLTVVSGERVVVVGPSGSGKTTLLRIIAGLVAPEAGEVRIAGRVASTPDHLVPPYKRGVGFVFQSPALWPHMTVAANVAYGVADLGRAARAKRVEAVLADLEIDGLANRYPDQVSGGEARRVALARALAPSPAILLMDEPLASLDRPLKERLVPAVLRAAEGRTLIFVTHDEWEADVVGERGWRLADGLLTATP